MTKANNTEFDIFIAETVYPEAAAIFTTLPKKLTDIKEECFVVLDTNALFVPYAIGKESLKQIKKTYKALVAQNRLIIPGQVAREFAKNRAAKLVDLFQRLTQKRNSIPELQMGKYPLLEDLSEYKQAVQLETAINKQIQEYRRTLGKVLEYVQAWNWDDPVSILYNEIFTHDVVYDPSFDKDKIRAELELRYAHDIPPGYKDSDKDDKGIGDFLIWKTILDIGNSRRRSVILVSGEEKNDWRHKTNNQVLYPRYELVDEFRRESEGHQFHLIQFSDFLNLYGASEQVVQEVRQRERLGVDFHIKSNKLSARMRETDEGYLVLKGSQASRETSDSISQGWLELRDSLINAGILDDNGEYYEFIQDTFFASTSAAASVVLGRQAAGPISWLDDENRTYKEYKETIITE